MRERAMSAARRWDDGDDDAGGHAQRPSLWRRVLLRRPQDTFAGALAVAAALTIVINALFLQSGPHPAPIFANKPLPVPQPQPAAPVVTKPRSDIVAEIQRELTKRGFYDGAADGVYGPKTDSAIRDYEHAAGLRPSAEPNETLLQLITRSSVKARPAAAPARKDPIADLLAPSRRIVAVQRALADYGYGQIQPSGHSDAETRAAIEQFERERKLPVTGQISDRLLRELTLMTGRPLE